MPCPPDFSVPAKTNYIWLIEPGGADEPNRLYVGTDPGGLFLSDDGGDSFQLVDTLWHHPSNTHWFGAGRDHPGTVAIQVDPRDSRHLTVGISVGGVYVSRDGGESWEGAQPRASTPITCPIRCTSMVTTRISSSPVPRTPMCSGSRTIAASSAAKTAARQWQDISDKNGGPAGFGFALTVDDRR